MKNLISLVLTLLFFVSITKNVSIAQYSTDINTVALYHFDETTGSTVIDASGNANNGTAVGTSIINGKFGKARSYSGSDRVEVSAFNPTGAFTVEAWVNANTPLGGEQANPVIDHGL
ncbi:MAG: hypothetical protein KGZ58_03430, partial [Ignavibacteriales bacterium]|nr:hypothetical protein [Ignavibacteriales bacterium]